MISLLVRAWTPASATTRWISALPAVRAPICASTPGGSGTGTGRCLRAGGRPRAGSAKTSRRALRVRNSDPAALARRCRVFGSLVTHCSRSALVTCRKVVYRAAHSIRNGRIVRRYTRSVPAASGRDRGPPSRSCPIQAAVSSRI